jgi:hypothetical protein
VARSGLRRKVRMAKRVSATTSSSHHSRPSR